MLKEIESGKTPKQLIEENKASKNTVYRYWKRYQMYKELQQKLWDMIVESV
jgi:DNA-binding CsgD family transcriptional regulator